MGAIAAGNDSRPELDLLVGAFGQIAHARHSPGRGPYQLRRRALLQALRADGVRLGIAIIPAYTRGPALLAMSVAAMAEAAPGRFVMGLGTSSNVIVEQWNATPFDRPYQRVRDTLRFLRKALANEKVTETYETFAVSGFKLARHLVGGDAATREPADPDREERTEHQPEGAGHDQAADHLERGAAEDQTYPDPDQDQRPQVPPAEDLVR